MTRDEERRPVLALVESNTTGTGRMFAAAARARELRPLLVSTRPERYPWVADDAVETVLADTSDTDAVVRAIRSAAMDGGEVAGVTTSSEYFVTVAAEAAARLELPGPDPVAVGRCRDKRSQRNALAGAGVPVPAFVAAGTPDEAAAAAAVIGFPVVVKPADGTGSRGVRLCRDAGEVRHHAGGLLDSGRDERGQPARPAVLVEEYVSGPEFSVETFGTEVVGVTAKHLGAAPWFVETGHDFPAEIPPPGGGGRVGAVAVAAVEALGLGFGPAHTEVRLDAGGPAVIEVNPRLAGGRIPTLVRLATGIDLVGATVDAVIGRAGPLPKPGPGHASIRFLVPARAGRVRRTGGVAGAAGVPGVVD
ncbi:MAG TPA: ATP-grasp domain-containing protein, partial [Acidimicrobiia bacterium]|nr:ATP-grasp domain-containing protein [Acidimicrobiia bacterium]